MEAKDTPASVDGFYTAFSFILVGMLWGCTNPLLKNASTSSKDSTSSSLLSTIINAFKNWRFTVPFLINQSGSVVFVYLLGSSEISMAVPVCNSLTFVFTAITSRILGEIPEKPYHTYGGMFLVLCGIAVCFQAKQGV